MIIVIIAVGILTIQNIQGQERPLDATTSGKGGTTTGVIAETQDAWTMAQVILTGVAAVAGWFWAILQYKQGRIGEERLNIEIIHRFEHVEQSEEKTKGKTEDRRFLVVKAKLKNVGTVRIKVERANISLSVRNSERFSLGKNVEFRDSETGKPLTDKAWKGKDLLELSSGDDEIIDPKEEVSTKENALEIKGSKHAILEVTAKVVGKKDYSWEEHVLAFFNATQPSEVSCMK